MYKSVFVFIIQFVFAMNGMVFSQNLALSPEHKHKMEKINELNHVLVEHYWFADENILSTRTGDTIVFQHTERKVNWLKFDVKKNEQLVEVMGNNNKYEGDYKLFYEAESEELQISLNFGGHDLDLIVIEYDQEQLVTFTGVHRIEH